MAPKISAFLRVPLRFSDSIGFTPFHRLVNGRPAPIPIWMTVLLVLGFMQVFLCIGGEFVYLCLALRDLQTFFDAVELVMCIGFLGLSVIKVGTIQWQRALFTWLIGEVTDMAPKTARQRLEYGEAVYLRKSMRIMRIYSWVQMFMIWLFNLYPLVPATYGYATHREWRVDFPYKVWYPFDSYVRGWFEVIFVHQVWAGYVSAAGILAADLWLCGICIQICMQFDRLAYRLRHLKARGGSLARVDLAELRDCVIVHNRIIKMTDALNDVFGVCILINVVSSSVAMCVLGFLVMILEDPVAKLKFSLTLISYVIQVWLISLLGEMLLDASSGVADAAWEGDWIEGTDQHRLGIQLIINRAQQPQYLRAYKFLVATMQMFTSVMSTSWRFFALLQQVYDE